MTWNLPYVGRWGVTFVPAGWYFLPEFGIRQEMEPGYLVSNISLVEDPLPEGKSLTEYVQSQAEMISKQHKEVKLAGPQPSPFNGAEEACMLLVRHRVKDTIEMLHVQNYVRVRDWIGIVTLTTPEQMLRAVRPDHDAFVKGLVILPERPTQDQDAQGFTL